MFEIGVAPVGPLPPSHGYTYLLMCIDKSTHLREVNPMVGILRRSVPLPCSMDGSHALESQQSSQGTEAHNSPPPCGWPPFFFLISDTTSPQLSILSPTA